MDWPEPFDLTRLCMPIDPPKWRNDLNAISNPERREASNASAIGAYEKKVASLEHEKAQAEENLVRAGLPRHILEASFELALTVLSSHCKIWKDNGLERKKTALRLAFVEPVPYCRNQGLRPPKIALPFKASAEISGQGSDMARPTG